MRTYALPRAINAEFLIPDRIRGVIDPDNSNGNRAAAMSFELVNLLPQIPDDPINLLDHCFKQNLDLYTNFDCCYLSTRHPEWRINPRVGARDDFAQSAIPTSRSNATSSVC